ncbi:MULTISPECIES: multiple monosaccharide ABC transporter ATP-binding protein [Clostridium]|jgi:ABC-type sugar transport system, ATPase component|uniref:ABC transporter ATP-binding protein n=5 Tax=Clostridium TaxID=1485 RepID=A0A0B5QX04_CLOBE|nr:MULTISPECIES: multiple monosaccharide ABC transporter ATP-binding protein [Clostridium]ABR36558.1 ABC transporter related [Clostridium beijerinckii NCIMB 8052]AIU01658.1 ABC transporter related protein [Clostridium beijerinckii ATCC 35702]AJH01514.1 ABC transporter ATP-binding protein [Clostridium beijerinckii]ALB44395.1 ATP-binding cassette domain-containing protein [Clostridium beijerinckii NRRL B-598]AQS07307.1 xylose import ATP-binding protein XylG [Clostridium beijerinckii]
MLKDNDIILEMINITKTFPGVKALDNVNLRVQSGEIHSLCGENGAGKSTLMKVLSGIYPHGSYEGAILYNGKACKYKGIKDSEADGIVIIHQELALSPHLSIGENIFIGNEIASHGVIDWQEVRIRTKELLKKVGLDEDPDTIVNTLGVGKQQLIEIAKALSKNVKLLILDEPTASLNEDDSENLLKLMLELKSQGITCILISHKLNEVSRVCDSITVLRDGASIETLDASGGQISEDRIVKGMVGRELTDRYPKRTPKIGDVMFEIKDWNVYHPDYPDRKMVDNVNIKVRKGEVLGIAGLMGAGRTELAMSIFGRTYGQKISGSILKEGKEIHIKTVKDAINAGIAYVTEDRKEAGLNLIDDIRHNISIASLGKISNNGVINEQVEILAAEEFRKSMKIKTPSILQITGNLSGGNQQKVVLSRWVYAEPDLLILDEPTRGIDVGAKYEIYTIINDLVAQGKAVIVISSELPEVLGLSDRIYVMNEGKIIGELDKKDATQEVIMSKIVASK